MEEGEKSSDDFITSRSAGGTVSLENESLAQLLSFFSPSFLPSLLKQEDDNGKPKTNERLYFFFSLISSSFPHSILTRNLLTDVTGSNSRIERKPRRKEVRHSPSDRCMSGSCELQIHPQCLLRTRQ